MPDRGLFLALGLSQGCSNDPTEPVLETEFTAALSGANERPTGNNSRTSD